MIDLVGGWVKDGNELAENYDLVLPKREEESSTVAGDILYSRKRYQELTL